MRRKFAALIFLITILYFATLPASSGEITPLDKAKAHIYRGEPEQALEFLQPYIRENPNNAEAYFVESQIYWQEEKFDEAIGSARKAVSLDTENDTYLITLGDYLYALGKNEKALQVYYKLILNGAKSADIYRKIALSNLKLHEYSRAEASIKIAEKLDPNNCSDILILADIYSKRGNYKKASIYYSQALDTACSNKETLYTLAGLFEDNGNIDKAIATNEQISAEYPEETQQFMTLSRLYREKRDYRNSIRYWLLYTFKGATFKQLLYSLILILFTVLTTFLLFRFFNAIVLLPLILIAGALRKISWLELFSRITSIYKIDHLFFLCNYELSLLEPRNTSALFNIGKYHEKRNKLNKAKDYYLKITKAEPSFAEAWFSLGVTEHRLGRYKEAELALKKALNINDDNYLFWYYLGLSYNQQQMFEEACRAAMRSIEIMEGFQPSLDLFIESCKSHGNISMCEDLLLGLMRKHPNNLKYLMETGNILLSTGRARDSLEYFERSIELAPESYETWYNYGVAQREAGLPENAALSIKKAIELSPESSWIYTSFGLTQIMNKKFKDAERYLRRALELDPFSTYTHFLMANLLKDKEPLKARKHLEMTIKNLKIENRKSAKPWQKANEYECIAIVYQIFSNREKAEEALHDAVKYAKVTPSSIWIFSEEKMKLTPPDEFIQECINKLNMQNIKQNKPEVSIESTENKIS